MIEASLVLDFRSDIFDVAIQFGTNALQIKAPDDADY